MEQETGYKKFETFYLPDNASELVREEFLQELSALIDDITFTYQEIVVTHTYDEVIIRKLPSEQTEIRNALLKDIE